MVKQISGQSIRYEPITLGIDPNSYHPTSLERFQMASGSRSMKNIYERENKSNNGSMAMATTETLQRTLAQNPRETVYSNGLTTAPLISGLASDTSGGLVRQKEAAEGRDIMLVNTIRDAQNIPQI